MVYPQQFDRGGGAHADRAADGGPEVRADTRRDAQELDHGFRGGANREGGRRAVLQVLPLPHAGSLLLPIWIPLMVMTKWLRGGRTGAIDLAA
jgi:hypothetical protein